MIMIHSCNKRLWYVNNFLIPELMAQGAKQEEIILWNDDDENGCLKSWVNACLWIERCQPLDAGIWHLQDDVLIVSDFVKRIAERPTQIVCNGYVCSGPPDDETKHIGYQHVSQYWMSFPCCYIPNKYIHGFVYWFYQDVLEAKKYADKVRAGLYDDFFSGNI